MVDWFTLTSVTLNVLPIPASFIQISLPHKTKYFSQYISSPRVDVGVNLMQSAPVELAEKNAPAGKANPNICI